MMQEFTQQVENSMRAITDEVHTMLPAKIVSFNGSTGMASAKPVGKFTNSDGETFDYPVVTDAPVVFPFCQSAGVGMAFPVVKGDSCMILVSEVELDEWRSGAEAEGSLRFDLSSAVILPGLMKKGGGIIAEASGEKAAIMACGSVKLSVTSSGVKIKGNLTVTGDIKSTEGTVKAGSIDLKTHTHTSSAPGSDTSSAK